MKVWRSTDRVVGDFGIGTSVAASSVIAVVALLVFFLLRDYGPESAIRRFVTAAVQDDRNAISQVTVQAPGNPYTTYLVDQVQNGLAHGAELRLFGMDRTVDEATAQFGFVKGPIVAPVIFVVRREKDVWRVDTLKSATAVRRAMGMDGPL